MANEDEKLRQLYAMVLPLTGAVINAYSALTLLKYAVTVPDDQRAFLEKQLKELEERIERVFAAMDAFTKL